MTDQDRIAALREALLKIEYLDDEYPTWHRRIAEDAIIADDALTALRAGALEVCRRLRQERDSARRNLAALEWLALRGYPVGQEPGGHRVSASPEPNGDPWFDSWEECARNAGMLG